MISPVLGQTITSERPVQWRTLLRSQLITIKDRKTKWLRSNKILLLNPIRAVSDLITKI